MSWERTERHRLRNRMELVHVGQAKEEERPDLAGLGPRPAPLGDHGRRFALDRRPALRGPSRSCRRRRDEQAIEFREELLKRPPLGQNAGIPAPRGFAVLADDDDAHVERFQLSPEIGEVIRVDHCERDAVTHRELVEPSWLTGGKDFEAVAAKEEADNPLEARIQGRHEDLDRPKPANLPHFCLLLEVGVPRGEPKSARCRGTYPQRRARPILLDREAVR